MRSLFLARRQTYFTKLASLGEAAFSHFSDIFLRVACPLSQKTVGFRDQAPKSIRDQVHLIDPPSVGAGETDIIGIPPAVANAIYNVTGIRLREPPLKNDQIQPG